MGKMIELRDEIAIWQAFQFPTTTLDSAITHLSRECMEVSDEVKHIQAVYDFDFTSQAAQYARMNLAEECADVFHLIVSVSSMAHVDFADVIRWRPSIFAPVNVDTNSLIMAGLRVFFDTERQLNFMMTLLFNIAKRAGFSLEDAVRKKFAENKIREWAEPDADGVVEHVR